MRPARTMSWPLACTIALAGQSPRSSLMRVACTLSSRGRGNNRNGFEGHQDGTPLMHHHHLLRRVAAMSAVATGLFVLAFLAGPTLAEDLAAPLSAGGIAASM